MRNLKTDQNHQRLPYCVIVCLPVYIARFCPYLKVLKYFICKLSVQKCSEKCRFTVLRRGKYQLKYAPTKDFVDPVNVVSYALQCEDKRQTCISVLPNVDVFPFKFKAIRNPIYCITCIFLLDNVIIS